MLLMSSLCRLVKVNTEEERQLAAQEAEETAVRKAAVQVRYCIIFNKAGVFTSHCCIGAHFSSLIRTAGRIIPQARGLLSCMPVGSAAVSNRGTSFTISHCHAGAPCQAQQTGTS